MENYVAITFDTAVLPSVRAQAAHLLDLGVHELGDGAVAPLQALALGGDDEPGTSLLAVHPRCRVGVGSGPAAAAR